MDPLPPHLLPSPYFQIPSSAFTSAGVVPSAVGTQIVPPAPPVTAEAAAAAAAHNHVAHAANATAPTVSQSANHPPYTDMIYAAITALKEKDGSSKRAIAKYIERIYPGLPPTHSALLTHHLKRLKSTGLLVMVKKSYKLPRSGDDLNNNNDINNTNTNTVANSPTSSGVINTASSANAGPKRGRGRPPKPKTDSSAQPISQFSAPPASSVMVPVGLSISTQPILSAPAPTTTVIPQPSAAQPQVVGGVKRGRGRPPKVAGGVAPVAAKRRGRPPKSPGRPKKLKSVTGANGVKKGPKRLPKSVVVPYATGAAAAAAASARPRGRPRKGAPAAAIVAASAPAGGAVVVQGRRPGRPPKVVGGVVVNPKKRPVGRPKKNANVSWAATGAAQLQTEAYGDLKTKFEFFQSKVRQAVGVLRPQLTNETPISVVAAFQELEGLASMDINAPLREEAQPPPSPSPPPPPPPPQQPQPQPPLSQN